MLTARRKCVLFLVASLGGVLFGGYACESMRPPPQNRFPPSPPRAATASDFVKEALEALQGGGIPPAPLSIQATRQERKDYLLAVERASRALEGLLGVQDDPLVLPSTLIPPQRAEEVLLLGRVLAVELADAIDGGDASRASRVLMIAYRYADFNARGSVSSALCSEGITEVLAQGLASVRNQLDAEIARQLVETIDRLLQEPYPIDDVISHELERVKAWRKSLVDRQETLTVDQLLGLLAPSAGRRRAPLERLTGELRDYLYRRTGQRNIIPPELMREQTAMALQEAERVYDGARKGKVVPVAWDRLAGEPLATLFLTPMRTWLEGAGKLPLLRKESLSYLRLYVKLLCQPLPETLDAFGKESINPLTGHPFYYRKTESGFELLRVPSSSGAPQEPSR